MKLFALACAVVVVIALLFPACSAGLGPAGVPAKGVTKLTTVRTMEARQEQVERVVEITGTLAGAEQVMVSAEAEGRVERVAADLGDVVKEGGLLVQLAPHVVRLQAAQAEADYATSLARIGSDDVGLDAAIPDTVAIVRRAMAERDEARLQLSRIQGLFEKKVATQSDLDSARTRAAIADAGTAAAHDDAVANIAVARSRRAAWGLARRRLADSSIVSPVAGVVAARLVSLGEFVHQGQVVASIVVADTLKLRADVPERYADVIVKGLALDVDAGALSTLARGVVARVGPLVDASSRTFPIEATFDNKDGRLKPGTFARARVVMGLDEAVIAVPETAVSNVAGVTKVYVVDEAGDTVTAAARRVVVLRKRGSDALLTGDLKPGDRVIISAIARLFPGATLEIEKGPAPPSSSPATPATPATPPASSPATPPALSSLVDAGSPTGGAP